MSEVKRYGINADGGLVEEWGGDEDAVVMARDYDVLRRAFTKYGRHLDGCQRGQFVPAGPAGRAVPMDQVVWQRQGCTCGLDTVNLKSDDPPPLVQPPPESLKPLWLFWFMGEQ